VWEEFFFCNYRSGLTLSTHRPDDTDTVTSRLFRKSFNCRYNPRMDYAFCLLTLKSSEKWWSPLFGAICNFNDQILPYSILFLAFINTNVFYSHDVTMSVSSIISALISCNFTIKNYVNRKITSYLLIFTKSLWLHVKHFIALTKRESGRIWMCYGENGTVKFFETLADNVFRHNYSMMQI
jgi:hypothetical protein